MAEKEISLAAAAVPAIQISIFPTQKVVETGVELFFKANNLVGNSRKIAANGKVGGASLGDGASGGGAGGTIIMDINNYRCCNHRGKWRTGEERPTTAVMWADVMAQAVVVVVALFILPGLLPATVTASLGAAGPEVCPRGFLQSHCSVNCGRSRANRSRI